LYCFSGRKNTAQKTVYCLSLYVALHHYYFYWSYHLLTNYRYIRQKMQFWDIDEKCFCVICCRSLFVLLAIALSVLRFTGWTHDITHGFSVVRVAQSLVFCLFCRFVLFLSHCIVCPIWLPITTLVSSRNFEDTKGIIRSRKSKDRQRNGQKNKQRSTTYYTKQYNDLKREQNDKTNRKLKIEQHEQH
jgi:hypothetical protein